MPAVTAGFADNEQREDYSIKEGCSAEAEHPYASNNQICLADDFGGGSGAAGVTVDNDVDTFEGPATRYAGEVVVGA